MEQELAYSFHLGSDKNKSKLAKKVAKDNLSGTTSLSNNAIQNAKDLSDVNKHNLRDYDNHRELIRTIYGTNDIVNDVKQVYLDEFEQARIEYNTKQNRDDSKSYNKFYEVNIKLKEKQKDRNQDINVNEMGNYREIKKQLKQKEQKLEKENNQTKMLDNSSNDIKEILNNLKSTKLNKNNMVISNEDVQKIKNYTENVKEYY